VSPAALAIRRFLPVFTENVHVIRSAAGGDVAWV